MEYCERCDVRHACVLWTYSGVRSNGAVSLTERERFVQSWVRNATASSVEGRGGAGGTAEPAPSPVPDAEAPARRRRHRPLYRRLFHYVRTAWTGVKFALGNIFIILLRNNDRHHIYLKHLLHHHKKTIIFSFL